MLAARRQFFTGAGVPVIELQSMTANIPIASLNTSPFSMAVSPDGNFVYVAQQGNNQLAIINTTNNTWTNINANSSPDGLAINPAGTRVYVAAYGANAVAVVNTSNNSVIATITVGSGPRGVAVSPDGTRVYVANEASNTVSVIDASTNTVLTNVSVSDLPRGIVATASGVYVTRKSPSIPGMGFVSVINPSTNTVAGDIMVGDTPIAVTANSTGSRVYVSNYVSNTVSVIDTSTNTVTATINTPSGPRSLALNPSGTRLYVPSQNFSAGTTAGVVSVFDTASNTAISSVIVGRSPRAVVVNPAGNRLYVSNYTYGGVLAFGPGTIPQKLTGVTYTQSSVYSSNLAADYEYMNNDDARGATSFSANQTGTNSQSQANVRADCGSVKYISKIVIGYDYQNTLPGGWGPSYTNSLTVQMSVDAATWTTLPTTTPSYDQTGSTNGLVDIYINGNWRYVRIMNPNGYVCLLEFQVWGY